MARHIQSSFALGCFVSLLLPAAASATGIIFSNFGSAFAYDTTVGDVVGNAFDGNTYAEGSTFTPSTNAIFGSLQIALSCVANCPSPFTVALANDSGSDAPGSVIESFSLPGIILGPLGVFNIPLVLPSVVHPTLLSGTQYWVTVSSDLANSIAWNLNSTGDVSDQAISTDQGVTWFSPSSLTPGAYELDTASTAAPEPATIVLLAAGLSLCLLRKRLPSRG
jgi:hypothetical protein